MHQCAFGLKPSQSLAKAKDLFEAILFLSQRLWEGQADPAEGETNRSNFSDTATLVRGSE